MCSLHTDDGAGPVHTAVTSSLHERVKGMGSGASSLNPQQSAELTKLMKEEYEKVATSGQSEEAIRLHMTNKYNEFFAQVLTSVPAITSTPSKTPMKAGKGPTRRRSFGEEKKDTKQMAASQSTPSIGAVIEQVAQATGETEEKSNKSFIYVFPFLFAPL